jgi:hypothetical protein
MWVLRVVGWGSRGIVYAYTKGVHAASGSPKEIPQAPVYAPNLVEGKFCELRQNGVLRSSLLASPKYAIGDAPFSVPVVCSYRVTRIPILLLCTMPLSAIFFLLVGCGGSGSQGQGGQQEAHTTHHQSANVVLKMQPEGNSGVSGTASFEDTSEGVVVRSKLTTHIVKSVMIR